VSQQCTHRRRSRRTQSTRRILSARKTRLKKKQKN